METYDINIPIERWENEGGQIPPSDVLSNLRPARPRTASYHRRRAITYRRQRQFPRKRQGPRERQLSAQWR